MFLVFKTVSEREMGLVKRVGQYLDFVVGWLDDSVKDIVPVKHLNATIIEEEDVALAWKYAGNYSGYISVRSHTLANDQLDIVSSTEADGTKVKYYLTETDIENAAKFMKIVLRKILDEVYDRRLGNLNLSVSKLEEATWPTQISEAWAYKMNHTATVPVLSSLATVRGITQDEMADKIIKAHETYTSSVTELLSKKQLVEKEIRDCKTIQELNVVIHRRYGYNMPAKQQKDMNWEGSSVYDL